MKLRRFVGSTMAVALAQVKHALGPDAMILETRAAAAGEGVEVTAAVDHEPIVGAASPAADVALATEVRELSRLVRTLVGGAWRPEAGGFHPELADLHRSLHAGGMDGAIAAAFIGAAAARMAAGLDVDDAVVAAMDGGIAFASPVHTAATNRGRGPSVHVFFGPPGDGKTTTIAKLAGRRALAGTGRVALVSADTYRLGGAAELGAYARALGVPYASVATPGELAAAVARFDDVDEVLVDTAGVGSRAVEETRELCALAAGIPKAHRTLVVSATTTASAARRIWDALQPLRPAACVVTKVDEGPAVGILEACWRSKVPVAWLGTGRGVPHDLEDATAARLATWLRAA